MPSPEQEALVAELVATYEAHSDVIATFRRQVVDALENSGELMAHVHSIRSRLKDANHLRGKLFRRLAECDEAESEFPITCQNLLSTVNDLVGIRVLHLYTRQIQAINGILLAIFAEQQYELREGPFARTWDDESRAFFEACNIETQPSDTMYTSVHYIIDSASKTLVTCEVQVRTLMEEVWGEVDHLINYPQPTPVLSSREQLKVLARVTSSASRLVDSIFLTHEAAQD